MNSFGTLFRIHIFGESHGRAVGICIDGCPAGLAISAADFVIDMERRAGGKGSATTARKEADIPVFLSGVFNDKTTGAPLTIMLENADAQSATYAEQRNVPRPGHADLTALQKFGGYADYRGGGHFSGRLTAAITAAGVVAKKILSLYSGAISCRATLVEAGGEADIEQGIAKAVAAGDSIGGIVECVTENLPPGLGEPFFNSAESLISHLAFSVPAIKGIEFGAGFAAAKMFGSAHNDSIENKTGKTATNHAGGISGGIINGNDLVFRVVVKPASSTPKEQYSLNISTDEQEAFTVKGRHDLCIALRVPVVMEAAAAIVLADLLLLEQRVSRVFA